MSETKPLNKLLECIYGEDTDLEIWRGDDDEMYMRRRFTGNWAHYYKWYRIGVEMCEDAFDDLRMKYYDENVADN